ncbi:MAG: class A beta-lactamase-related serine hydrolase [Lachnospiraceae bacterium]|nr:class A beta-lactamase-related serine hydrolase [Lachnospiraceae bacterium]
MRTALTKKKKKTLLIRGGLFLCAGSCAAAGVMAAGWESSPAAVSKAAVSSAGDEPDEEVSMVSAAQEADGADSALILPEELESLFAEMTGIVPKSDSGTDTESGDGSENEQETDDLDADASAEREQAILDFLEAVELGEDFQIPMAMPEELGTLSPWFIYHCGRLPIERAKRVHPWQQAKTLEDLEETLRTAIAGYDGSWSVYVKNLNTDESFVINDQPMKSASVMKLFIMGAVYTAIEDGELERTDSIMSLMNAMITYSDNESSNQLLYILGNSSYADGIAKVNEFIQSHGYSEMTVEYNGFSNSATNTGNGVNQVAAKDVGQLLEDIYRRTWMSRAVSNEMEEMLLAQNTRYKIPAGLPDGVICGNKSGEMSDTQNDAAIIYSDACDYILVVLSNGWSSTDSAISRISSISSMVYDFFN